MNRKKISNGFLLFIAIIMALSFNIYLKKSSFVSLQYPLSDKIIVIDPGHGGIDPGKVGLYGEDEKFLNFKIAIKLKGLLESSGAKVVMTREDNEGLYIENSPSWIKTEDMAKRRKIIRQSKGHMMISIHMNSYPDTKIFGAQTFYLKGDKSSEKLGKLIQEELVAISYKYNKREAKENDSYFIIKDNHMPSLVVECGFLSNIQEEQMLNDEEYQKKIVWAIMKGITRYFYES